MFAVIKTGGKQYRVAANDLVTIEKIPGEVGASVSFGEVLMLGDGDNATLGAPTVAGASVAAEVVEQTRGPKLIIFKKKRRKHHRRRNGHRQPLTVVRITDILASGTAATATKAKTDAPADAAPAADAAESK